MEADERATSEVVEDLKPLLDPGVEYGPPMFIISLRTRLRDACPKLVTYAIRQLPKYPECWPSLFCMDAEALDIPWDAKLAFFSCTMKQNVKDDLSEMLNPGIAKVAGRMRRLRLALMPYLWEIKRIASMSLDKPTTGSRFLRQYGSIVSELR